MSEPNVFVARTFSKAYGMAGMRIGYAIGHTDNVKPLARLKMPYNISVFGRAGRDRGPGRSGACGRRARAQHRGPRLHGESVRGSRLQADGLQGNFIFVDIGQPARGSAMRAPSRA
jgi:histidinol-phosphate aminotransferase